MPQLISELNFDYGYIENRIDGLIENYQYIRFKCSGGYTYDEYYNSQTGTYLYSWNSILVDSFLSPKIFNIQMGHGKHTGELIRLTYLTPEGDQKQDEYYIHNAFVYPNQLENTFYIAIYTYDENNEQCIRPFNEKGYTMLYIDLPVNSNRTMLLWRQEQGELDYATNIATLSVENNYTYKDNSIEQGVQYLYGISSVSEANDDAFIMDKADTIIDADFEDIFLSDADHSLRIRFNPKVSTFKTTLQEQKIDTIGGRFPIFVRNGNLKYRELALSGLISYEMDDYFLFNSNTEVAREATPSNSFTPFTSREKFYQERKFKLAVEEWLTNGKPKIFRSAAEGNYIIRLMNVSLSPEDKLSRMLHTFSATGYEVDAYTYENLVKWNLRMADVPQISIVTNIATNTTYGIVKGSLLENHISINADGTMQVNSINLDKLTQTDGDYLILGDV